MKKSKQMKPISAQQPIQHNIPKVVEEFNKVKHKEVFGPQAGSMKFPQKQGSKKKKK